MKITSLIFIAFLFYTSCRNVHHKARSTSTNQGNLISTSGKVISILDGDTYDILFTDKTTERIRMQGIDAPEKGMPYYKVAKNYLGELCSGQEVKLKITGKDHHDRTLAWSYLPDGTELSHEMLKAGLAWHFTKYNNDKDMAELESTAKANKTGLWADPNPMTPWDNRKYHRQGISTKDSFNNQNEGE